MTTKKRVNPEAASKMMDWKDFWNGVALAVIAVLTFWNNHQTSQNSTSLQEVVATAERTEAKVDLVKNQTDGTVTANLKTLAISAENLAVSTKTEKDIKAAKEAWAAYDERVLHMQKTLETP